ncbi:Phospholipase A and acyltransferase 1 [Labeo rohita]|uniref:Phospholipase A and acyltransferase 1 n=1 Tax=Labeo rohita TaxID=84645 RepID=A0ABQ8L151_LABRO|nr:Phospholipase A and acyltransferase 1 [Labeo rohita]
MGPRHFSQDKHRVSSVKSVLHSKATVKKEKLKKVVQNNEYRINNLLDKQHQPRPIPDILENAESYVGKTLPYDLFTCNCEHFVTKLRYGKGQSKQVQKVVAIAAAVAAAVFFGIFLANLGPDSTSILSIPLNGVPMTCPASSSSEVTRRAVAKPPVDKPRSRLLS